MPTLHVVLGPTAVGKTAYAIELAQRLGTEIVSCDSRQFYSELNIGVARPSPDELAAAPHHFIACRSVCNPYNAFDYGNDAFKLITQLFLSHNDVVAVGGSGLYVDALCHGINLLPDPSPELRQRLSQRIANGELPDMLDELARLDPSYYASVDRSNPIRVQRALEVCLTAGVPYSQLLARPLPKRPFEVNLIALLRHRDLLRNRIYRRVDLMMKQGLLDEVKSLQHLRHLNTLHTVGYRELFAFLDGSTSLQQAIAAIKNNTWHYAKKQLTWIKRYDKITYINL